MKKGDKVYTRRFCTVKVKEVFQSRREAREAGYTEDAYYNSGEWLILGKSTDFYHMEFAAAKAY